MPDHSKPSRRLWRLAASAVALALLPAVVALPVGAAAPPPDLEAPAPIPVEEVTPGLKGYGLSVFQGGEPERFDVEVIGVMHNVSPETSYILARLSGRSLEDTGVIAGMSGSPIYLDGRLAGAVAFSWPFSKEAIAGITPIEAMRRLAAAPAAGASEAPGRGPVGGSGAMGDLALSRILSGDLPDDLLQRQLARLAPRLAGGAVPGWQWSALGFGASARELLAGTLGAVAPSGEAPPGFRGDLAPGAAVAGVLVDGDLRLAVTGTVTDRRGDELLAFGHPFLGIGSVRLPMATAQIVTVLANQFSSFKIANFGEIVGSFDLDRLPGVRGRIGLEAPMIPLRVEIQGMGERRFDLQVAEVPMLTPLLVAVSTLGTMEAASQAAGEQGIDLTARYQLAEHGELELRQTFDGPQAAMESAIYLLAVTGYLVQNRLEEVRIEGLDVEIFQSPEPRLTQLVGAHAGRTLVRPGERVELNVDLVAYRGERLRRVVEVVLPTGIPSGRYSLLVGDGVSVDAARLALERAEPVDFAQALELMRSFHSRRDLVVLGVFGQPGLAVAGEVLPQLPGSMRSLWAAASSGSALPLRLTIAQEHAEPLPAPIEGIVRIDLEVRRREPFSPAEQTAEGEASAPGAEGGAETDAGEEAPAEDGEEGEEPPPPRAPEGPSPGDPGDDPPGSPPSAASTAGGRAGHGA